MRTNTSRSTNRGASSVEISFTLRRANGRNGNPGGKNQNLEPGNVPRISRLMALALRFEGLILRGEVRDYADLARLGYVTRARITQIMNLLNLAPDIQEALLFLPRTVEGRDAIGERDVRRIVSVPHWNRQRKMWTRLVAQRLN